MGKIVWKFENETGAAGIFTTSVLSASYKYGREKYVDTYSGGNMVITINNASNQIANFALNDRITVVGDLGIYQACYQVFWVAEIQYEDYPGNTGMPTATLICADVMNRVGRALGNNYSISAGTTGAQVDAMDSAPTWPPYIRTFGYSTSSQASAATLTTSFANRINLNQETEAGLIFYAYGRDIQFIGRGYVNNLRGLSGVSIGRTPSATVLAYQQFTRQSLGQSFFNSTTVNPDGLSSVTASNASSVATYGQNGQSISTVDATTDQATGLAEWQSNALSNPNSLTFVFSWNDLMQNDTALLAFVNDVFGKGFYPYVVKSLAYRVPGAGADTTVDVVIEGWSMNLTPQQAQFTMYASPLTYYQFFTLDSSTLGILDTSRLGW